MILLTENSMCHVDIAKGGDACKRLYILLIRGIMGYMEGKAFMTKLCENRLIDLVSDGRYDL